MTTIETYRSTMTEKTLHEAIVRCATTLGWRHFHAFDMRRSDAGFPDLLLLHPTTGRRLAIEVKAEQGVVGHKQEQWLADMAACGIPVVVVRPVDWLNGSVEAMLR